MTARRRSKPANAVPLIIENHPEDYDGYPFITLIQQHATHVLTIVDDVDEKRLRAFVLDLCGPSGVNEEQVINVAAEWYQSARERYPLSIEFSKRNLAQQMAPVFRTFNIDFITRIIGPVPKFSMNTSPSVRRRRRKPIPEGMTVNRRQVLNLHDTVGSGFTERAN